MPKQVWKIDKFEGGINDKSDPRDILDNQMVTASGIEVNNLGKIIIGGGKSPVYKTDATEPGSLGTATVTHGYGLVKFGTDYSSSPTNPVVAETKYLGFFNDSGHDFDVLTTTSQSLHLGNGSDWVELSPNILTSGSNPKAVFYYADGALRISDANFANSNTNKWIGVVKKTLFGGITLSNSATGMGEPTTEATSIGAWVTAGQTPPIPTNTQIGTDHNYSVNTGRRDRAAWHVMTPLQYFYLDGLKGHDGSLGVAVSRLTPYNAHIFNFCWTTGSTGGDAQGATIAGSSTEDTQDTWLPIYKTGSSAANRLPYQVRFSGTAGEDCQVTEGTGYFNCYPDGYGSPGNSVTSTFDTDTGTGYVGMGINAAAVGSYDMRCAIQMGPLTFDNYDARLNEHNQAEYGTKSFYFDNSKSAYIAIKSAHKTLPNAMVPDMWAGENEYRIFSSFGITLAYDDETDPTAAIDPVEKWSWSFNPADFYQPVASGKWFVLELNPASSTIKSEGEVNMIIFDWSFTQIQDEPGTEPSAAVFQCSDFMIGDSGCAMNEAGFSGGAYNFGITNVIEGDSESSISDRSGTSLVTSSRYYDKYQNTAIVLSWSHRQAANTDGDGNVDSWHNNITDWSADNRIKGQNLYIQRTNSDNWFRIAELNLGTSTTDKGGLDESFGKFVIDTPWINGHWSSHYDTANWVTDNSPGIRSNTLIVRNASLIWDYAAINAFADTSSSIIARFKTATQMNRQIYIGGLEQESIAYSDRMIKSPINKFDIFPSKGREIDVIVKDGDHITAVEGFADRILQFKKNSVNVINCTKDSEFLETTLQNIGVEGNWAVIKTDVGIAFVNDRGCFLYDGEKFVNLIENKIDDTTGGTWDTHVTSDSLIGYQQKGRKILVTGSADNKDVYVFSLQTGGWTLMPDAFSGNSADQTNLVTFFDGLVYWVDDDDDKAYVWQDKVTQPISIITKDIDFGHPGVRKKVSKVYVTYSGTPTDVTFTYDVDGGTSLNKTFSGSFSGGLGVFTPSTTSQANNIYSIQLKFDSSTDNVAVDFEINDISIIYRMKNVK